MLSAALPLRGIFEKSIKFCFEKELQVIMTFVGRLNSQSSVQGPDFRRQKYCSINTQVLLEQHANCHGNPGDEQCQPWTCLHLSTELAGTSQHQNPSGMITEKTESEFKIDSAVEQHEL